ATGLVDRARALPASAHVWAVSSGFAGGPAMPEAGNLANLGRIFRAIENFTLHADLRDGVAGTLNGQCKTELDAKNLSDAVRGLVGMGRLSVPENQPELLRLYDGIKVDQQQRSVIVNVLIAQALVDQFLKPAPPRKK
ncbi:MAG: hypothetical protein ACRD96_15495, partial [Bryobacteraceae bacterium]